MTRLRRWWQRTVVRDSRVVRLLATFGTNFLEDPALVPSVRAGFHCCHGFSLKKGRSRPGHRKPALVEPQQIAMLLLYAQRRRTGFAGYRWPIQAALGLILLERLFLDWHSIERSAGGHYIWGVVPRQATTASVCNPAAWGERQESFSAAYSLRGRS